MIAHDAAVGQPRRNGQLAIQRIVLMLVLPERTGIQFSTFRSSFQRKLDCVGRMPKRTFAQRMARRARGRSRA